MMYMKFGEKGNPLGVDVGLMLKFISSDTEKFGYVFFEEFYTFFSPWRNLYLEPGQWVIKDDEGNFTVQDEKPGIKV